MCRPRRTSTTASRSRDRPARASLARSAPCCPSRRRRGLRAPSPMHPVLNDGPEHGAAKRRQSPWRRCPTCRRSRRRRAVLRRMMVMMMRMRRLRVVPRNEVARRVSPGVVPAAPAAPSAPVRPTAPTTTPVRPAAPAPASPSTPATAPAAESATTEAVTTEAAVTAAATVAATAATAATHLVALTTAAQDLLAGHSVSALVVHRCSPSAPDTIAASQLSCFRRCIQF